MAEYDREHGRKTRKFGDKVYHAHHACATKKEAEYKAKLLKEEGRLVRIVPTKYWYVLYIHNG